VSFTPKESEDFLYSFEQGVNSGVAPALLPKNQLFTASNTTTRGTFASPRPPFFLYELTGDVTALESALSVGPYQGGCYFKPDNADERLLAAVGGRLFEFVPDPLNRTAVVKERTIPGDPNPSTQPQAWLWQSEKWVIWNDGLSTPVFITETTAVRSAYTGKVDYTDTTAANFIIPAVGVAANMTFTSGANVAVGDIITLKDKGTFVVNDISASPVINVTNLTASPVGQDVNNPADLSWSHLNNELPPGRMGVYGMGRNWICLVDGKQFVASDLVGGSSGTITDNYRDAVLHITENNYLSGGGNFTVPGSIGDITFMRFMATPDTALGQGPLMVGTHTTIFSCQAPVDRTTWSNVVDPILTNSIISNGGLSQWGTININADLMMRSIDGIRSYIQARREYATWGNTPISREVDDRLSKDSPDLLPWSSAVYFDNRLLMTTSPVYSDQGVYFQGIVPLNFDPVSSLRGKGPTVYDATVWTGINTLQLLTGLFSNVDRTYAFTLNTTTSTPYIELYEILKSSSSEYADNGNTPITWTFETSVIFNQVQVPNREMYRLIDGEIFVDQLKDTVTFQVYYKPDQYPCWTPWFSWSECGTGKDQFRPRMGLGEPNSRICDNITGRPMREGFSFQLKFVITGHCRFLGARIRASTVPLPKYAPQSCTSICT